MWLWGMLVVWYASLSQSYVFGEGEHFSLWADKFMHGSDGGSNLESSEWQSSISFAIWSQLQVIQLVKVELLSFLKIRSSLFVWKECVIYRENGIRWPRITACDIILVVRLM
jgi:hypothetical protein